MKLVICVLCMLFAGCASLGDKMGTTFMIKKNKDGGRIMINGTGTWMEAGSKKKADKDMSAQCPNGFEIVEEGLMERPTEAGLGASSHVMEKYFDFRCNGSESTKPSK